MKKLLWIIVLGLLLSGNAYAKTIKCDNNYNNGTSIFTYDTNGINSEAKYFDDVSFDGTIFSAIAYDYKKNLLGFKKLSHRWYIQINTSGRTVLLDRFNTKNKNKDSWFYVNCR